MTTQASEHIIDIIVTQFKRPREQLVPDAEFSTDLGFDSLEQVEFIIAIEEAFNIQVPDEDADQIQTIQQAIDRIEQALK